MIITCPSCAARFRVAVDMIGAEGRVVRCGRCAYSWHQLPLAPEPAPLELSEPLVEPGSPREVFVEERRLAQAAGHPLPVERSRYRGGRHRGSHFGGWLLFLLLLAALAAAAWYWRDRVVAAVPQAAQVYAWLGVDVAAPSDGRLELANYTVVRRLVEGERKLVVSGEVANRTAETVTVPTIRARVLDESGNEILFWDFQAAESELAPGATTRFESMHEHPDYAGELDVEIGFAPAAASSGSN